MNTNDPDKKALFKRKYKGHLPAIDNNSPNEMWTAIQVATYDLAAAAFGTYTVSQEDWMIRIASNA